MTDDKKFPNCGEGPYETRADVARYRALFDTNCVTRWVCRDIWRKRLLAEQGVKP